VGAIWYGTDMWSRYIFDGRAVWAFMSVAMTEVKLAVWRATVSLGSATIAWKKRVSLSMWLDEE
jgi:hypothetical protein